MIISCKLLLCQEKYRNYVKILNIIFGVSSRNIPTLLFISTLLPSCAGYLETRLIGPNSQTINPAAVTQSDRMSLTIFFAIAIHAILILGISFDLMDNNNDVITTMEITLVSQRHSASKTYQ